MDLISIRRKYRNIRNIIIGAFFAVLCICLVILLYEIRQKILSEEFYMSYVEQYQRLAEEEQARIEQQKEAERQAKLPKLTDEGKNNIANIYHSDTKRVFLTFDDGPSQSVTIPILEITEYRRDSVLYSSSHRRVIFSRSVKSRSGSFGFFPVLADIFSLNLSFLTWTFLIFVL